MKHLVRVFLFNVFALWFTSQILPTLIIASGWQVLVSAGLILSLLMLIVAPLLRILFIPINILTLGLLSWIINVVVIYLLTILATGVQIKAWNFPGISAAGFLVPGFYLSYIPALVVSSLGVTFISNLLHKVSED